METSGVIVRVMDDQRIPTTLDILLQGNITPISVPAKIPLGVLGSKCTYRQDGEEQCLHIAKTGEDYRWNQKGMLRASPLIVSSYKDI